MYPSGGSASRPPLRHLALFGALFISTGAALVVYILSAVSLPAALLLAVGLSLAVGRAVWRRSSEPRRAYLRRCLVAGVAGGLVATAAYDVARFLLVNVAGFEYGPFDALGLFGLALLGPGHSHAAQTIAGIGYHLANGVGFALAYTVWWGRKGVLAGILWATLLEATMVSIYPGWLDVRAMDEFLSVSVLGHLCYGTALGYTAKRLLTRSGYS